MFLVNIIRMPIQSFGELTVMQLLLVEFFEQNKKCHSCWCSPLFAVVNDAYNNDRFAISFSGVNFLASN